MAFMTARVLCFSSFRQERERLRARAGESQMTLPLEASSQAPRGLEQSRAPLNDRQVIHRRRMLEHIERHRTVAREPAV